jgi:hypothetical protein
MRRITPGSIYTSIPPAMNRSLGGKPFPNYQEAFIRSWKDAGFRIVSINSDAEIKLLKRYRGDVEFISNGSDDRRSKLSDFFNHMVVSEERHAGIVNADCILFNCEGFVERLLEAVPESIVLVERLSLDPDTVRPTGRSCSGFDGFFFDPQFLPSIRNSEQYEIGEPVWDFWFPLAMSLAGAQLKTLHIPLILHVDHPHKWGWDRLRINGDRLIEFVLSQERDPASLPGFRDAVQKIAAGRKFGDRYIHNLCALTFESLRSQTGLVSLSNDSAHAALIGRMLVGLSQSKELYFRDRMNELTLAGRIRKLASAPQSLAKKIAKRLFF